VNNTTRSYTKCNFVGLFNNLIKGVGHVIFNLRLGVGHSVWCQIEKLGHVFSIHHTFKCSGQTPPPPRPIIIYISRPLIINIVMFSRTFTQTSLAARAFGAIGVNGGYISFNFIFYICLNQIQ